MGISRIFQSNILLEDAKSMLTPYTLRNASKAITHNGFLEWFWFEMRVSFQIGIRGTFIMFSFLSTQIRFLRKRWQIYGHFCRINNLSYLAIVYAAYHIRYWYVVCCTIEYFRQRYYSDIRNNQNNVRLRIS